MPFGLIIIGDEILSGKRQDKHFGKVVELLAARGLQLAWAQYLGDDRRRLVETLSRTFAADDIVFSCGGIGATPDDHTRQAAAEALGVALELHPQAAELIAQRTAEMAREGRGTADMSHPENRQRLRMGEFPVGARIIPNAFNRIPGFSIRRHWFVPGFPVMAWPMIESVLDTEYRDLHHSDAVSERALRVYELPESAVTPLMEEVERRFPAVRAFSLPSMGEGGERRHIELGVKGARDALAEPFELLRSGAARLGGRIEENEP